jgi:hypothetical protein
VGIKEKVLEFINEGYECEFLDFKAKMYPRKGSIDLLKDILAMANSSYQESKFIIIGVKDDILNGRNIIGIDNEAKVDASSFQQYVLSNIEPDISFEIHYLDILEKNVAVIELKNTNNRPYMIKKNVGNLHEGCCLIRKGSMNAFASRSDFDGFYNFNQQFELRILDNYLRAIDDKNGTAYLDVSLRNLTQLPITIINGGLLIKDGEQTLSQHKLFGLNNHVGADFRLEISPFSEKTGDFYFGFNSSDCIRLGLDEYGLTDRKFTFELILFDTLENRYCAQINEGHVFAKGKLLWKVKMGQKK